MKKKVNGVIAASKIVANVFNDLYEYIKNNDKLTTLDMDLFCKERIESYGAKSACYNYPGETCNFPRYTCISINEEICHGIAKSTKKLKIGDIVSVDICVNYNGFYGDSCITFIYRKKKNNAAIHLLKSSYEVMMSAIEIVKPGVKIGTLGYTMNKTANKLGYSVIEEFAGHYIGTKLHMYPLIPFIGKKNVGPQVKIGDTFTIEPMIIGGSNKIIMLADGWTAASVDGSYSAQFEHTILVTEDGFEILTLNKFTDNFNFIV